MTTAHSQWFIFRWRALQTSNVSAIRPIRDNQDGGDGTASCLARDTLHTNLDIAVVAHMAKTTRQMHQMKMHPIELAPECAFRSGLVSVLRQSELLSLTLRHSLLTKLTIKSTECVPARRCSSRDEASQAIKQKVTRCIVALQWSGEGRTA